jgi:uncharacterized coiled-coil protein SlyX
MDFQWPLSDGGNVQEKLQYLEQKCASLESQVHTAEITYEQLNQQFQQHQLFHQQQVAQLSDQFHKLDSKFDTLDLEHRAIMESDMVVLSSK